jgi:hypothetical protein
MAIHGLPGRRVFPSEVMPEDVIPLGASRMRDQHSSMDVVGQAVEPSAEMPWEESPFGGRVRVQPEHQFTANSSGEGNPFHPYASEDHELDAIMRAYHEGNGTQYASPQYLGEVPGVTNHREEDPFALEFPDGSGLPHIPSAESRWDEAMLRQDTFPNFDKTAIGEGNRFTGEGGKLPMDEVPAHDGMPKVSQSGELGPLPPGGDVVALIRTLAGAMSKGADHNSIISKLIEAGVTDDSEAKWILNYARKLAQEGGADGFGGIDPGGQTLGGLSEFTKF